MEPCMTVTANREFHPVRNTLPSQNSIAGTVGQRLISLDAARVIATLGVVWFHAVESTELHTSGVLGRFSVAFYTMAAMVFLVDSSYRRRRPYLSYALDRVRRLYLPFLGWGAITYLAIAAFGQFGQSVDLPPFSWDMLADA